MTTPDTPGRDLVAELRQRVQAAQAAAPTALSRDYHRPLAHALAELDRWLGGHLFSPAPDPFAEAVAAALLGFRADIAQDEWCVFAGDDPATTSARVVGLSRWSRAQTLRDRIDARDFRPGSDLDDVFGQSTAPVRIARRASWSSLHRTPWQVVDTEGGEPRA